MYGSNVVVSASTEEKIRYCVDHGAIGGVAYLGVDINDENNSPLKFLPANQQFDCIFDAVGPSQSSLISGIIRNRGKWVLYGLLSGIRLENSLLMNAILRKNLTVSGFTLRSQSTEFKSDLIRSFKADVLPRILSSELKTVVDRVYEVEWEKGESHVKYIDEAHNLMASNLNKGKIVVLFK